MTTSRQLAAIVFADIQGYTALMQRDEAKAMQLREKFQKTLEKEIRLRNGRIAVFSGDGALCVFKSAIEAVRAAIVIQEIMQEQPSVPLRIGIHIGDVITEGKNVFGDGVNVASRIETFAVPGSVFLSSKVADEIKNHAGIETFSLGKFSLKNVNEPLEIFAIKSDRLVVPKKDLLEGKGKKISKKLSTSKKILIGTVIILVLLVVAVLSYRQYFSRVTAEAAPRITSLGVLPFANLSGQKDDEYFADGVCDEILTQLSKLGGLNVLSRTSTLQFRNTKKTMREIGAQIGADVLLEGSVQKSNGKVRINVQLIDAVTDKHLWAETYDRELKDVFSIQSDIASQIAESLNATLSQKEEEYLNDKPTGNLEAYDLYLRGNKLAGPFWSVSRMENVPDAIHLYEQAIKLDPKFLHAYAAIIALYVEVSFRKPVVNYEEYRDKAKFWLDKLIALKIDKPIVHAIIAMYKYEGERDYEGSLAEIELFRKSLPGDKQILDLKAYVLRRMGRVEEALQTFLIIARAYPKEFFRQWDVGETYSVLRKADSAIYYYDKVVQLQPGVGDIYMDKASIYVKFKGDFNQAEKVIKDATLLVDSSQFREFRNRLTMLKGNYDPVINYLQSKKDSFYDLSQSNVTTYAQMIAIMLNNQGKKPEAKIYFQKSLDILSKLVELHPEDFRVHSALGICYAGLGETAKAFEEGNKAKSMMPVTLDAIIGLAPLENLALINTLVGEQDAAVDILHELLKHPFGWDLTTSIPLYKTHPYWKLLQSNPRFQKMVQ